MTRSLLRRSRTTWVYSAVLVLAFVLAGSGAAGAHGSIPGARPAKPLTNVHVDLNWVPNVEFSGIWVGIQKGWFKKAGLNLGTGLIGSKAGDQFEPGVRPYDYSNTPESENDLCLHHGGELCIGIDDSSAIPIARQAGQDLTALWAGSQKTPFGYMTCYVPKKPKVNKGCKSNTGRNITKMSQFKGLKVGYQQDELYVPELMLGSVRPKPLSLSDVQPQKVLFDPSVLTTGTVDAYLVFINNEPIQLKLEKPSVRTNVIHAYSNGMAAFYADDMFVNDSQMTAKYKPAIKKFVSVVDRGWKYAMHNHASTARMVVQHFFRYATYANPGCDAACFLEQQQIEIGQFANAKSGLSRDKAGKIDGIQTLARWKTIIHDLKTTKGSLGGGPIITANIKPQDCFTDQFDPPAAR